MYVPNSFREARIEPLQALIEKHPLGLLITHGASGLQATPVPFRLYPDEGEHGVLRAHLARANPHWRELADEAECLVMFQGPDAYVTPSWYPGKALSHRAVPTWNYIAVEVRGRARAVADPAWLRRQLEDLTRQHEGIRPQPWSLADAPADYIAAQLQAIVGIELPIAHIEGKWKLSQNRTADDRQGVISGLCDRDDPHGHPGLAAEMQADRDACPRPAR